MADRTRIGIKADALLRKVMWRTLSGRLPLYLVTEYPKSGGTWFSQMLADALGVPYPQNRAPRIEPCVLHGHHLYHPSFRNVFCVVRDGRDAMCSAYFHVLFDHGVNAHLVKSFRGNLDFEDLDDVRGNMPRFIEYMFSDASREGFRFTWSEFIRSWTDRGAEIVRYEDLLRGAGRRLHAAIEAVVGTAPELARCEAIEENYSFARQTRRKPGEENRASFLRKGVAGDWKEKFSREAREVFHHHAGEELIRMGYEPDAAWVGGHRNGNAPSVSSGADVAPADPVVTRGEA